MEEGDVLRRPVEAEGVAAAGGGASDGDMAEGDIAHVVQLHGTDGTGIAEDHAVASLGDGGDGQGAALHEVGVPVDGLRERIGAAFKRQRDVVAAAAFADDAEQGVQSGQAVIGLVGVADDKPSAYSAAAHIFGSGDGVVFRVSVAFHRQAGLEGDIAARNGEAAQQDGVRPVLRQRLFGQVADRRAGGLVDEQLQGGRINRLRADIPDDGADGMGAGGGEAVQTDEGDQGRIQRILGGGDAHLQRVVVAVGVDFSVGVCHHHHEIVVSFDERHLVQRDGVDAVFGQIALPFVIRSGLLVQRVADGGGGDGGIARIPDDHRQRVFGADDGVRIR